MWTRAVSVYAKRPFSHPSYVIEYLGRYTHKVALSNHRIRSYENGKVIFSYKDYRHGNVKKEMELEAGEFIRRFAMHIVPRGFVRIRHYGILSSTSKRKSIPAIKCQLPEAKAIYLEPRQVAAYDPQICPCCGKAAMITITTFSNRGPPPVANAWNIGSYFTIMKRPITQIYPIKTEKEPNELLFSKFATEKFASFPVTK